MILCVGTLILWCQVVLIYASSFVIAREKIVPDRCIITVAKGYEPTTAWLDGKNCCHCITVSQLLRAKLIIRF